LRFLGYWFVVLPSTPGASLAHWSAQWPGQLDIVSGWPTTWELEYAGLHCGVFGGLKQNYRDSIGIGSLDAATEQRNKACGTAESAKITEIQRASRLLPSSNRILLPEFEVF
jgi:hypothetical protein